jgi:hypothetical protein
MARAPVSKFYCYRHSPSLCIPECPNLSTHFVRPSVPHPFLSRLVPARWVAIWVAKYTTCSGRVRPTEGEDALVRARACRAPRRWGAQMKSASHARRAPPQKVSTL